MASLGCNQLGRFSKRKPKLIKWRFLKHQPTKRKMIDVGRRIIDLRYFAERFDDDCYKCGEKFELKNIIKETNLGLCSSFHFVCTNCSAVSVLKSSDTFSKYFFLVWFDALCPGKQFFSHVGTEPTLPSGITSTFFFFFFFFFLGGGGGVNMSCSRTQHGDPSGA